MCIDNKCQSFEELGIQPCPAVDGKICGGRGVSVVLLLLKYSKLRLPMNLLPCSYSYKKDSVYVSHKLAVIEWKFSTWWLAFNATVLKII